MKGKSLSRVRLFATPWTAAYQTPPPMGFSRQEYWSGVPWPSPILYLVVCDKIPMPGHLFEGNPVDEGTTRRGTDTPVHRPPKPQVPHTTRQVACHPVNNSRGKRSSITPHKTRSDSPVPTLQGPCYPSQKWRGTLTLLPQSEIRSSSIAPVPVMSRALYILRFIL